MRSKVRMLYFFFLSHPLLLPAQPTPTSKFLQGYVGAVTSAVSLAVSVSVARQRRRLSFQLHRFYISGLHTEEKRRSLVPCF